jgi:hypothetical protein
MSGTESVRESRPLVKGLGLVRVNVCR